MPTASQLEKLGGVGQFKPLTTRRFFSGLFTLRSPLNQPGDGTSTRYYDIIGGGRSDALLGGLNVEVTPQNTLALRPGWTSYATPGNATLGVMSAVMFSGTAILYDQSAAVKQGANTLYTKTTPGTRATAVTVGNYTFLTSPPDAKVWDGSSATADTMGLSSPVAGPTLIPNSGTGMKAYTGWAYVYTFYSTKYGHVGTASPASASTGAGAWSSITVNGNGTSASLADKIQIYRTVDGGANYLLLATIANPGAGSWSYVDTMSDQNLNTFVVAPLNGANNTPPANVKALTYHANRLWGISGNNVYYSGGPDTTNGNGLLAWPPGNYFTFPTPPVRLVPYSNGLLVFTMLDTYAIMGNVSATALLAGSTGVAFFPKLQQAGMGILSYWAVDSHGTEIYVFTTRRQFLAITPGAGVLDVGYAIGNQLTAFNPASSYVAYYQNGEDDGVYLSDGTANIYRMCPRQYPEGNACWSPVQQPSFGCSFLGSMYDTTNTPRLFVVDSAASGVYYRDQANSQDNATSYTGSVTIGPVVLSVPGEIAEARAITLESVAATNQPTLSVLMNEISGTFVSLPNSVPDPTELPALTSVTSSRYYLNQATLSVLARTMQVKVSFQADGLPHELLGYTVYGQVLPKV